jgi:hypothetical protein
MSHMTSIFTFSVPTVTNMDRLLDEVSSNPGGEEFFFVTKFKPCVAPTTIYILSP